MIRLYEGGGSSELIVGNRYLTSDRWSRLKHSICLMLRRRGNDEAARFLEDLPLEVFDGTNGFGDEFQVLYWNAPFEDYMNLADQQEDHDVKRAFRAIAEAVSEVGPYIRFIAVSLDPGDTPAPVPQPTLRTTSEAVRAALADAEHLIHSRGALSGLDRAHTAFHGYLRAVVEAAGITAPQDASVTQLFRAILDSHPSFSATVPRAEDLTKIARAMATIVDAINPVRNRASLAHPNEDLLQEPEAMLVINAIHTLLHYLDSKVG